MEFCPGCILRHALADRLESGDSSPCEDTIKSTAERATQRFEHYELVKGENGKPVELGRGTMGVTYKAVDVDLHCPVTLKMTTERYLDDESALLRFLGEACAAAPAILSNSTARAWIEKSAARSPVTRNRQSAPKVRADAVGGARVFLCPGLRNDKLEPGGRWNLLPRPNCTRRGLHLAAHKVKIHSVGFA
jgi:hypothetical protein